MPTVASDSEGNVHIVWSENTNHLFYKLFDARGNILIDSTRISNAGQVKSGIQISQLIIMILFTLYGR